MSNGPPYSSNMGSGYHEQSNYHHNAPHLHPSSFQPFGNNNNLYGHQQQMPVPFMNGFQHQHQTQIRR